ncbi:hypothetical protein HPB49_017672 [Dermacentor silvarum]|uniref:Uncharacterized protein n=1 Tax=Dermacentor silvarum TaxID=543639 RepID=A0ACB8CGD9_DERSI|nr:hypothetical protein HPB49_017672 [Dermacentor silvarum]
MSTTQERVQDSANVHHANDIIKPPRLVLEHQGADSPTPVTMVEPSEGESKRPRLEETHNQDNDNTSNYDLSDYEDIECDEAPFTSATYKKKRSEGIPLVFRPSEEGHNFWQVNPNRVSSEIVSAAKEKVQTFRVNRDGSFSVCVTSVASANNLLLLQEVAGLKVFVPYGQPNGYVVKNPTALFVFIANEESDLASRCDCCRPFEVSLLHYRRVEALRLSAPRRCDCLPL